MVNKKLLDQIRKELRELSDPAYCDRAVKYFREKVDYLGVSIPVVRKLSGKYFRGVKGLAKEEIFALCEMLFGIILA